MPNPDFSWSELKQNLTEMKHSCRGCLNQRRLNAQTCRYEDELLYGEQSGDFPMGDFPAKKGFAY